MALIGLVSLILALLLAVWLGAIALLRTPSAAERYARRQFRLPPQRLLPFRLPRPRLRRPRLPQLRWPLWRARLRRG